MKLINQSFEIIEQPNTTIGLFKHIEKACRICYKSEDKITDTSYQRFLTMIRSNGHLSPWEHGTVYMKINAKENKADFDLFYLLLNNKPWVRMSYDNNENWYITTNYRAIIENKLENLWEKYRCSFTGEHTPRITVKFITSIGISRELNRHRCHSICEESTRYCNYSKDKFNNELTFIKPVDMDIKVGDYDMQLFSNQSYFTDYNPTDVFILSLLQSEESYLQLIKEGFKPQQARDVLPLATKTEVIHTAFIDDWIHFFELRCSNAAHPQIRELANNLKQEFIKRGYIHE